jgi:hypothetical protein
MSAQDELDVLVKYGVSIPADRVRPLVEALLSGGGPEWGSVADASKHVGMSPDFWQDRARAGEIPGAFQRSEGGPWVLPLAECRAHLARESTRKANAPKKTRRGPWKAAS